MTEDTFATRLKGVLEGKRIMLKQVAEALSVSPSAVHKWTRGGEIEYERLLALARFLGVNWLWLRYGEQAIADLETSTASDPHIKALRQKHLAEIMESEARMKFAQEVSGIVTWEWNVLTDGLTYSSNDVTLFGRHIRNMDDFWACVHPADVARCARCWRARSVRRRCTSGSSASCTRTPRAGSRRGPRWCATSTSARSR